MKQFLKNAFKLIPFALGVLLTLLSLNYMIHYFDRSGSEDYIITSFILGIIGIPLLVQSIIQFRVE